MTTSNNKPVFKASIGAITVTVWQNEGERSTYYTTDITRSYRNSTDGTWGTSTSYNHDDLLNVAKLAQRAESYISKQKQKSAEG